MIIDLPPDHPAHRLSDAVHQVVVRQTPAGLGVGAYPRPAVAVSTEPVRAAVLSAASARFDRDANRVVIAPHAADSVTRAGELMGTRWNLRQQLSALLIIHEHLHGTPSGRLLEFGDPTAAGVEEAAVSAVAADLLPQVVRAAAPGTRVLLDRSWAHYQPCAHRVRVASTVATNSRSWRDPAAAGWRMRLLMSLDHERRAMLVATGTDPADVCPPAQEAPRDG